MTDFFGDFFPPQPNREPDIVNEVLHPNGRFTIVEEIWLTNEGKMFYKTTSLVPINSGRATIEKDLQNALSEENYRLAAQLKSKLDEMDINKEAESSLNHLKEQLAKAVEEQNYALAAELQQQIKDYENGAA